MIYQKSLQYAYFGLKKDLLLSVFKTVLLNIFVENVFFQDYFNE